MEDFSPQIPKFQSRVNKKRGHIIVKKQREDLKISQRKKINFQKNNRLTASFSAAINGR